MIVSGVGSSSKHDSIEAISEAYDQAIKPLGTNAPSFLLLFASLTSYDQKTLLTFLKQKNPTATIVGASTSGEISSAGGSADNSVVLMAIYSDQMRFVSGVGRDVKTDSRKAGQDLAEDIMKNAGGEKPKAILMMPDGLLANGEAIVDGVLDKMGPNFMLAGGSAGDDYAFKGTYEYLGDEVLTGCVVGVGLFGDFSFGIGVRHGLVPISTAHKITKIEGNILYELDNKPALEVYKQYLEKDINELLAKGDTIAKLTPLYPLGIHAPNDEGYLIRGILGTDEKGTLTLTASLPEGQDVFIMLSSVDEIVGAAEDAAHQAMRHLKDSKPKAIILFNCIARKKVLITRKQEEIDKIRKIFGEEVPLIGFYTYGEQAPLGEKIITCSFHNETDVLFVLGE